MDTLKQIILGMDRKEVKNYNIYAGRLAGQEGRKDTTLFEKIKKAGEEFDDEKAYATLYKGKDEKNSYYQLKNRLAEDINLSIFLQEHTEDESMYTMYLISLGYYYYSRKNNYKLALHYFKKAEKRARKLENHALLDLIYSRMIHITQESFYENPEDYIAKRKENSVLLNKITELENILHAVEYKVKISQNLSQSDFQELLKITIDSYSSDEELKDSPKLQLGIYVIITRKLLKDNDFLALEEYLIGAYNDFIAKKIFNKSNHSVKLEMVSWIANASFKNKKFHQSLEYAEKLRQEMERFDSFLYERFEFFYYNSLVINYSAINPAKAIDILLGLTNKEKMTKLHFQGVFVFLNLAVLYYMQKDFTQSLRYLSKLYAHEDFKNTEPVVQLKIVIGELIMRYDLGDVDTLEYRLKHITKNYREQLDAEMDWAGDFVSFVRDLISNDAKRIKKSIKSNGRTLIDRIRHSDDGENMLFKYDIWIEEKAKILE